jgi:hypothetical protein
VDPAATVAAAADFKNVRRSMLVKWEPQSGQAWEASAMSFLSRREGGGNSFSD